MLARLSPVAGLLALLVGLFLGARSSSPARGRSTAPSCTRRRTTPSWTSTGRCAPCRARTSSSPRPPSTGSGIPSTSSVSRGRTGSRSRATRSASCGSTTRRPSATSSSSPWIKLLTFRAPEYEMNACTGIVRWRIEKGLFVASQGREGDGYLEIEVQRLDYHDWNKVRVHVEVEVANFYPASPRGSPGGPTPTRSRGSTSSSATRSCAASSSMTSPLARRALRGAPARRRHPGSPARVLPSAPPCAWADSPHGAAPAPSYRRGT
jgi:hypothetical protein